MSISVTPVGIVHSPFADPEGMPIQAALSEAVATLEIYAEYVDGLRDITAFDYLILLYHFHLTNKESLRVTPFLDDEPRGVFANAAKSDWAVGSAIARCERKRALISATSTWCPVPRSLISNPTFQPSIVGQGVGSAGLPGNWTEPLQRRADDRMR